jgi:ABC-type transport system involved in multi-copper enzyme maturation permease subunit
MLPITRVTVREGLGRKWGYLFLALSGVLFVVLLQSQNVRWDDRPITDPRLMARVGLWMALTFASLKAVFTAMGTIDAEIRRGTTHLVLIRPVTRTRFWLERWMGVTLLAWLDAALLIAALTLALVLRCGVTVVPITLAAAAAVALAVACVTAFVTLVSTAFSPSLAAGAGVAAVLLGLTGAPIALAAQAGTGAMGGVGRALSVATPPLHTAVAQGMQLASGRVPDLWVLHQELLYVFVCVCAGLALFHRREI